VVAELAMERTRFDVRFNEGQLPESAWTGRGIDAAEFFVSPSLGEDLRPLARIVSGGELSRVMLAIKTLTATTRHGFSDATDRPPSASAPGLIFDEVDAGIGGRVADVVGRKLRTLGSAFQVLCITHLPQIASYADTHFEIEKKVEGGRTRTTVRRLDADGRVEELARMLGGEAISEGRRQTAREMLTERAKAPRLVGLAPPLRQAPRPGSAALEAATARVLRTGEARRKAKVMKRQEIPDRDVRLPDERPRFRTDGGPARTSRLRRTEQAADAGVVVINTCSPGAGGGPARAWATRCSAAGIATIRSSRSRMRGAAGRRGDPEAVTRVADVIIRTWAIRRLPMMVEQAGPSAVRSSTRPVRDVTFRSGHQTERPAQGVRDDHRRVQRVLQTRRPYTRGSGCGRRPTSTEVRDAATTGHREISCSARSSATTPRQRSVVRLQRPAQAIHEVDGVSGSGSPARTAARLAAVPADDSAAAEICRHLHLPVQSGSTRAEAMRRHTRTVIGSDCADPHRCRTWPCRPI
jgi:hypothetical protein